MYKFDTNNPERLATACTVLEKMLIEQGNDAVIARVIPRFAKKDGEYLVKVHVDDDGDLTEFEYEETSFQQILSVVTPKRLGKLKRELMEAAKAVVNPPNGED